MASKMIIDRHKNTKEALLEFLIDEKSRQEKSKSILLKIFKENQHSSKSSLKELLNKLNSNILVLDYYFTKIFEDQKIVKLEDGSELNFLSLDPQEATEIMKTKVLANSYGDIEIFCGLDVEIEKIIGNFVENKLLDLKTSIKEELRNDFENEKKKADEEIANLNKEIGKQTELINELYTKINSLPMTHQNKKSYNWPWYFTVSILLLLVLVCFSPFKNTNPTLVGIKTNFSSSSSNSGSLSQDLTSPSAKTDSLNVSGTPGIYDTSTKADSSSISDQSDGRSNNHIDDLSNAPAKSADDSENLPYSSVIETNELIICSQRSRQIYSVDVKTFKAISLSLGPCYGLYSNVFIPTTNSTLFYGEFMHKNLDINAFILDAEKKITKLIWAQEKLFPSLAYYENYVYAFGNSVSAKYNCLQNKWENLAHLGLDLYGRQSSSVGFKGHILIVERTLSSLISYDIEQNSFQKVAGLSLDWRANKIIFSADNRVYIIEFPGRIHQSAINDFTEWEIIATRTMDCSGELWSYVIRFNEKFYFECISSYNSILVEFDLKENKLKTISINI
ncbi:unnamed protein product [Blepharisma stoltei]|uniref:Uncharacterized protein n=1 Tax=Blepharisma stoltei TaxID=1481888 RepID=A0AAU9IVB1_9CILI|nr:unnamed protein product [Blepharisma stoltei]